MHADEKQMIEKTHNTARFFTEQRHISWVLLLAVVLWGVYGYLNMPKRKDPEVPVRLAVALTPWPGVSAEKVEDLVTRQLETKVAGNAKVKKIESISRTGLSVIYVELVEGLKDTGKEFDDIRLKLSDVALPDGAGPVQFVKDFGDTEALMLTVASPKADEIEIGLRAQQMRAAIDKTRNGGRGRVTVLVVVPQSVDIRATTRALDTYAKAIAESGAANDVRTITGDHSSIVNPQFAAPAAPNPSAIASDGTASASSSACAHATSSSSRDTISSTEVPCRCASATSMSR